jgi:hypothetical protein
MELKINVARRHRGGNSITSVHALGTFSISLGLYLSAISASYYKAWGGFWPPQAKSAA